MATPDAAEGIGPDTIGAMPDGRVLTFTEVERLDPMVQGEWAVTLSDGSVVRPFRFAGDGAEIGTTEDGVLVLFGGEGGDSKQPTKDEVTTPSLDDRCGEHLRYRDFMACSKTWRRLTDEAGGVPFDNVPRAPETFAAMRALCALVLDPVARRFGPIELTYAFSSPQLAQHALPPRHPPGDQHAGHEKNHVGKFVCKRLGFSSDFHVPGVDSRTVARWVVEHTAFDRLYFYSPGRPFHVSVGPDDSRQVVVMREWAPGKLIPRVVKPDLFLSER